MEKAQLKGMFVSGNMPSGAEYKAALNDVLQAFPYFQLAQVFYAKQMYDTHEPEASGRIKLASVYAPDRKAMYLLFKKPVYESKEVKPINLPSKPQDKGDVKYNFVYSSTTVENTKATHTQPKEEKEQQVTLSPEGSIRTEAFIRKELEAIQPAQPPVEKNVQIAAQKTEIKKVETIIAPPKKPYFPPVIEEKKPEPEKPISIEPTAPIRDIPLAEIKKVEPEIILPVPVNEPITDSNLKYNFNSWLKVIPEISIEKKQEIKPITQKETSTIIDKFLKKAPSISRPKAEFFSPVKAAKMSITEDDTIVSETLAEIYIAQGNLQRALKSYQTLLVQFPEKKNIFAPRIEEIKALIRQNTKPGTK